MPWRSIFRGDVGEGQPASEGTDGLFQNIGLIDEIPVGEHHIDLQLGRVSAQDLQVRLGREVVGLPGCGARLSATSRFARVRCSASASSGTFRCGSTLVNHEPGPKITQSASSTARRASGQAAWVFGHERDAQHLAGRLGAGHLAANA